MLLLFPLRRFTCLSPQRRSHFLCTLEWRFSAVMTSLLARFPGPPNNTAIPFDFIRNIGQPRLLLIVPEHACPSWYSLSRGFIASKYASDAKVDGDEALYLPCLYYFLRSDVKTGFGHFLLSEALNLMTSVLAAWTLGASVIP